jgi:hypothetical protein
METAKNPVSQQTGLIKASNQGQVEYAKGTPSRFLPGVSIVGQPAIDIKRGHKGYRVKQTPQFASQRSGQSQVATPLTWQSAPTDSFDNLSQNGLPTTFSIPQDKAIPSLYQTPIAVDRQDQSQSGSLLAHIADQICGAS